MAKEVEMSVRDTIDLDAALAQFIKEQFGDKQKKPDETKQAKDKKGGKNDTGN